MKFDMQIEVMCVRVCARARLCARLHVFGVCLWEEEAEEDEEQNRCHNAGFAPRLHLPRHI